ncbi:hypothetical protein B0H63DRAFT_56048 [Podospora didyma]|uniref:Uncharacterized protein n=1 Tax=Podospora didyma TaxID=330526 RepID=A0AAE0P813_9PEZI|nr:hypothetical protein B0H63DRAFT_56048 [Podospora didyma]
MEQLHTARRSASHGALNRSYAADHYHCPRVPPSHAFSRPLRSVTENASILPSPGPLESMLKTTTETGDIGLFSIKPTRSTATFHGSLRRRRMYSAPRPVGISSSDVVETSSLRDDRRHLPSYRDTASEIISMYASDSQRSVSSSLSPRFDVLGQRSYSMTTCSSRQLPNQKSNGTLQSQPSGSLQRPRSPFPYPTRLKRPGVRPSSPALTENGAVDYRRMVEIDRVSRRTDHGSYKPTYPHQGRRPTPVLTRLDPNRHRPSYSSYAMYGSQPSRALSTRAPASWGNKFRGRLDSSTSDSSRTASLTSIVDMYQPSFCAFPTQRFHSRAQPTGTFYYDYSEDFDSNSESATAVTGPLAPIPTRAPSLHRPMVLEDCCDICFHNSVDHDFPVLVELPFPKEPHHRHPGLEFSDQIGKPPHGQHFEDGAHEVPFTMPGSRGASFDLPSFANETEQESINPPLQSGCKPTTGNNSHIGVEDLRSLADRSSEAVESSGHEAETKVLGKTAVRIEQTTIVRGEEESESGSPCNSLDLIDYDTYRNSARKLASPTVGPTSQNVDIYHSLPLPLSKKEPVLSTSTTDRRRSKFYSMEPGLSDLASLVHRLDKTAMLDCQDDTSIAASQVELPEDVLPNIPHKVPDPAQGYPVPCIAVDAETVGEGDGCGDGMRFRGHRRNLAIPKITASQLPSTAQQDSLSAADRSQTPILSPQPISPARQLRLQNSVPQLMKALPPLPCGSIRSDSCLARVSIDETNFLVQLSPFGPSNLSTPRSLLSEPSACKMAKDRDGRECRIIDLETGNGMTENPDITARPGLMEVSPIGSNSSDELCTRQPQGDESCSRTIASDVGGEHRVARPGNGKLRLKVSRGALAKVQMDTGGTRKSIVPETAQGQFDIQSEVQIRICQDDCGPVSIQGQNEKEPGGYSKEPEPCELENAFIGSPARSTPVVILPSRPAEGHEEILTDMPKANEILPVEVRSSFSDESTASGKPARGLRKRISDLRVRLVESRLRSSGPLTGVGAGAGARLTRNLEGVGIAYAVTSPSSLMGISENKLIQFGGTDELDDHQQSQPRGFRCRISKLMKSARQAIMVACTGSRKRG